MLKKILQNLETGAFRIEYREHCDCKFYWYLNDGELDCDIQSTDGDCWFDNVLIMDDLALDVGNDGIIASYDAHFGLNVTVNVSREVEQEIINAINEDSDVYAQLIADIYSPDANNDLHDRRKRESLVNWLEKNTHLQTYVYYPRAFANEYVCVLLVLPHYYQKGYLQPPVHWYPKTAEEWAEMYLRKDTDGTQFDIGFELVNNLYEIDYCWYDRHADMTVSHDMEKYFFVDLQDAEIILNTLKPEGLDCYDLNKLTIDSFDGEIDDIDCQKTKWGSEAAQEARKNGNPFAPEPDPEPDPEKDFEHYSKEYGICNWQGIELTLIQDPYLSEDAFGDPCYYGVAIDREGNNWSIKWDINTHSWDNPVYAKMMQK